MISQDIIANMEYLLLHGAEEISLYVGLELYNQLVNECKNNELQPDENGIVCFLGLQLYVVNNDLQHFKFIYKGHI